MQLMSLLQDLESVALDAGRAIAQIRRSGGRVQLKEDGTPLTDADRVAQDVILERLRTTDGGTPVISEERTGSARGARLDAGDARRFYLVDPLDGTKEYVKGLPDYTVNIALIEDGVPVAGVVYAPERGQLFVGDHGGAFRTLGVYGGDPTGGEREPIRVREPISPFVCVVSASHQTPGTEAFIRRLPVGDRIAVGSSLKFCLIASGAADIYPRLGRTMQWDTAAADAVLRAAGGATYTVDGVILTYGPRRCGPNTFENPPFVAFAARDPSRFQRY